MAVQSKLPGLGDLDFPRVVICFQTELDQTELERSDDSMFSHCAGRRYVSVAGLLAVLAWGLLIGTTVSSSVIKASAMARETDPSSCLEPVAVSLCRQPVTLRQLAESTPPRGVLWLDLEGSMLDPRVCAWLGNLGHLEELCLVGTGVDDLQLEQVCRAPRLRSLDLRGPPISPSAVVGLAGLSELRWLDVRGTRLGAEDVAVLKTLHPGVEIFYDRP
jgi:hypothetical protein